MASPYIDSRDDKNWTDFIGEKASSVQVPDSVLKTLKVAKTDEDITITALELNGSVSLNTNNGGVEIDIIG